MLKELMMMILAGTQFDRRKERVGAALRGDRRKRPNTCASEAMLRRSIEELEDAIRKVVK